MTARPTIDPSLLATLLSQAPARVLKKIEGEAAHYSAIVLVDEGGALVATVGNERVTLLPAEGTITRPEQLSCSCLLSPRCAHLLGVARSLPLVESSAARQPHDRTSLEVETLPELAVDPVLDDAQRRAADVAFAAAASVVEHGASNLGALRETELLRAIHSARVASLPRLASALVRVVRGVRALASKAPELELEVLTADVAESLLVAHTLGTRASLHAIGRHRREMEPLGALRLTGLFTEPVIASTGHAGVVTTLVSDDGRFFTLADVRPGEPSRAHTSYEAGIRLGDATLSHRELCRAGLFVQEATVSFDGRLGQGQNVRAVRRATTAWHEGPTGALFAVSAADQITRALGEGERALEERRAGWDLILTRATLRARTPDALVMEADDGTSLLVELASDHPSLRDRDCFRTLGRCEGLRIGVALRMHLARSLRLALLALFVDPAGGARTLALPATLEGRLLPGLDTLHAAAVPDGAPCPRVEVAAGHDPTAPLARRLVRMVSGGRSSIGAGSRDAVERDARTFERVGLATSAAVTRWLADEALARPRDLRGARTRGDSLALARAFLAAAEVERTTRLALLAPSPAGARGEV